MTSPVLVIIAGPNGSGKSLFYETDIKKDPSYANLPFINADLLAVQQFAHPAETEEEMRWGQARANVLRNEYLKEGKGFIFESTFSHPSKVDLVRAAKNRGYRVVFFHLSTASPARSQERVDARVESGGHDVPAAALEARWRRNGPLIREAILLADQGHVFDADADSRRPRPLAVFVQGKGLRLSPFFPDWAEALYADDIAEA